jgi:hypothetical protein
VVAMVVQKHIASKNTTKAKRITNQELRSAMPTIKKIMEKSKANRRAIELLDEDQQEYLKKNARAFLASRMKAKYQR